jgi:hypothetical protein
MEDLEIYKSKGIQLQKTMELFAGLFDKDPGELEYSVNPMANNSKYMPIGIVEKKLDEFFSRLWSTENFRWQVVANEIVGSIDLKVYMYGTWITRTGCGSAMIQTTKGTAADVSNKIKNTLVKDFPHLKAECIKNAAKSLGVNFGRNLNRSDVGEYQHLSEKIEEKTELDLIRERAIQYIQNDADIISNLKIIKINQIKKATLQQIEKAITYYENKNRNTGV